MELKNEMGVCVMGDKGKNGIITNLSQNFLRQLLIKNKHVQNINWDTAYHFVLTAHVTLIYLIFDEYLFQTL